MTSKAEYLREFSGGSFGRRLFGLTGGRVLPGHAEEAEDGFEDSAPISEKNRIKIVVGRKFKCQ
jgi:hypothetical protein